MAVYKQNVVKFGKFKLLHTKIRFTKQPLKYNLGTPNGRGLHMGSQGVASLPSRASFPPHFLKSWERFLVLMIAIKHGHQPAQMLGWAALACHKQKDAAPDPGLHKHCLQNEGRPDERLWVRAGTWNVGSMSGRGTEVCEELRKRRMDVCCLQEVRWRGQGAQFVGVKGRRYN